MNSWPVIRMAGDFLLPPGKGYTRVIPDFELMYFPDPPAGLYRMDGLDIRLDRPLVVVQQPDITHTYIRSGSRPARQQFVHFEPGSHLRELAAQHPWKSHYLLDGTSPFPKLLNELLGLLAARPFKWVERSEALLFTLCSELLTGEAERSPSAMLPVELQIAIRYIASHLEQPITVADVAKQVGWSHAHLTRTFQRHLKMNVRGYIVRERVERGARLLAVTNSPVKEVAQQTGFEDERYFSRCFKTLKGYTPSGFRAMFASYIGPSEPPAADSGLHPFNVYFRL
ncbi:AraC family transcriptional regulator [Paenibacillus cymbidii]|uniref:AraC family transcriptional regulator n=1 Tax=Paenibacillus cymbidii TaxID=1639034 RepID=UPI001081FF65|nr:AraC family transcriptional regulator [Paenibacillus cymbidii]